MTRALARTWYRIENRAEADTTQIDLFDEIGAFGTAAGDFVKELRDIDSSRIELNICSPGGEVFDGLAIYAALKRHPATITVHVDGLAASIASVIAMAGDKVIIDRYAQMMIHEAHAIAAGATEDMHRMAALLDQYSDNIAAIYAERAGGSTQAWRERMRAETWYSASEAVKARLADEVSGGAKSRPKADWDLSMFNFAGRESAPDPFAALAPLMGMACPVHSTATTEGTWDAATHEGRLSSPLSTATAKRMYGWYDPARAEDGKLPKDACKLPHHEVGEDGVPGPANLAGVRNALARLGQSDIPDGDQPAVRAHLRAHLGDQPEDVTEAPVEAVDTFLSGLDRAHERTRADLVSTAEVVAPELDPAVFRAAMTRAVEVDYDPAGLRELMTSIGTDAPAPPEHRATPVDLGPALPAPPPAPPEPGEWDGVATLMASLATDAPAPPVSPPRPLDLGPAPPPPEPPAPTPETTPWDVFRAAMTLAANDAPAPPDPPEHTDPAHRSGFLLDASAFRAALRRATSE